MTFQNLRWIVSGFLLLPMLASPLRAAPADAEKISASPNRLPLGMGDFDTKDAAPWNSEKDTAVTKILEGDAAGGKKYLEVKSSLADAEIHSAPFEVKGKTAYLFSGWFRLAEGQPGEGSLVAQVDWLSGGQTVVHSPIVNVVLLGLGQTTWTQFYIACYAPDTADHAQVKFLIKSPSGVVLHLDQVKLRAMNIFGKTTDSGEAELKPVEALNDRLVTPKGLKTQVLSVKTTDANGSVATAAWPGAMVTPGLYRVRFKARITDPSANDSYLIGIGACGNGDNGSPAGMRITVGELVEGSELKEFVFYYPLIRTSPPLFQVQHFGGAGWEITNLRLELIDNWESVDFDKLF